MIKVVNYMRRNPNLTPEEFRSYWLETHAPLIQSKLPDLSHYTAAFPISGDAKLYGGFGDDKVEVDAIIELGFPTLEILQKNMTHPDFVSDEKRNKSSEYLLDLNNMHSFIIEQITII